MARVVRRVPADWEHPKDANGKYVPLHDGAQLAEQTARWDAEKDKWDEGFRSDGNGGWIRRDGSENSATFEDWHGERPDPKDYMPMWSDAERTHFMLYEDTSEGTPLSPAFSTVDELTNWSKKAKDAASPVQNFMTRFAAVAVQNDTIEDIDIKDPIKLDAYIKNQKYDDIKDPDIMLEFLKAARERYDDLAAKKKEADETWEMNAGDAVELTSAEIETMQWIYDAVLSKTADANVFLTEMPMFDALPSEKQKYFLTELVALREKEPEVEISPYQYAYGTVAASENERDVLRAAGLTIGEYDSQRNCFYVCVRKQILNKVAAQELQIDLTDLHPRLDTRVGADDYPASQGEIKAEIAWCEFMLNAPHGGAWHRPHKVDDIQISLSELRLQLAKHETSDVIEPTKSIFNSRHF